MNITKGKRPKAKKVLLYGPEGIGKTTLARQFPKPLFLDAERGTGEYDVDRVDVRAWEDVEKAMAFLLQPGHGYQTVVLDTIDSAVPLLESKPCREQRVSALRDLGYGKGYALLSERVDALVDQANRLVDCGIHVLFLAHSRVKRIEPPDLPDGYDKYELRLTDRVAGPIKTAMDAVLFANFRVSLVEDGGRTRAQGGRERVLHTTHSASHDAKNRCGISDRAPFHIDSLAPLLGEGGPVEAEAATAPQRDVAAEMPPAGHSLDAVVAGIEPLRLTAFLLKRGQISEGQTYRNLSDAYVQRVLAAPEVFRQCVLG
jgi:hypothetical protein